MASQQQSDQKRIEGPHYDSGYINVQSQDELVGKGMKTPIDESAAEHASSQNAGSKILSGHGSLKDRSQPGIEQPEYESSRNL